MSERNINIATQINLGMHDKSFGNFLRELHFGQQCIKIFLNVVNLQELPSEAGTSKVGFLGVSLVVSAAHCRETDA